MKRLNLVLTLAFVFFMIQAVTALNASSQDQKAEEKPASVKSGSGEKNVSAKKAAEPSAKESLKPVASVNGVTISQADLDRGIESVVQRRASMGQPVDDTQTKSLKMDVLNNLINRELLNQESKKQKIMIKDELVNEKMSAIKQRFKSDAEFKTMLSKMKLTESLVKTQLKEDLSIQSLIEKQIIAKIDIQDKDTKNYYDTNPEIFKQNEQVKASHILIKIDPKDDAAKKAEAMKKIDSVQAKLKGGGDFATLAKEFSECPSKEKGGELGFFEKGQMVKPFEDAVFSMKPGETSKIVETQFGYHIIKLTEKKPEGTTPYTEVKDQVGQFLKQEKIKTELDSYIANLEKAAKIEKMIK